MHEAPLTTPQTCTTLPPTAGCAYAAPTACRCGQLQQFFSPMLEEHQRLIVEAHLQIIKTENLKNKKQNARVAAWLQKNT
ncbi:hypothetical protein MC885_013180 [Smutsia gigantea]|nr:hypothetical protein MC885_013180 [Smutsia gigantea]